MGFLLGDSRFGQEINDGLGLNLQLAGQFIDADLFDFGHSLVRLFLSLCF